jgi:hypothetical protein
MADKGVSFAGDGDKDISGSAPKALPTGSLGANGPVMGPPETNKGMTSDVPVNPSQNAGMVPKGSGVQFAGDVNK